MLADDGLPGEDLAMKLGSALRRRLARFEGLPDEVAGVARTALQASSGVRSRDRPGPGAAEGEPRTPASHRPAGRVAAHPGASSLWTTHGYGTHPVARPEGGTD